ncbi:MAG: hypothetical protein WBG41_08995 [Acidimicrobiales bacterium]
MKATFGRRRLAVMALTVAIGASLASIATTSVAHAAATSKSHVTGKWNEDGVTGAFKIKRTGHHAYSVTTTIPTELVGGSSCRLPIGTIVQTFSGTGTTFTGQNALWYVSNCSFDAWTTLTLTLTGNTIIEHVGNGQTVTLTRATRR